MNPFKGIATTLCILACMTTSAQADSPGEAGSKFLLIPASARASGLCSAYAAASGDLTALDNNPAGITGMRHHQMAASHMAYYRGVQYSSFALGSKPVGRWNGALRFRMLHLNDIQRDGIGQTVGGENIKVYDAGYSATMGVRLTSGLRGALAVEFIDRILYIYRDRTIAFHGGLQWESHSKRHIFGASFQNAGKPTKFIDVEEPLPLAIRVGSSHQLGERALILTEVRQIRDQKNPGYSAGLERSFFGFLKVRGGVEHSNNEVRGAGGFGMEWKSYTLDYAIKQQNNIGFAHAMHLLVKWDIKDDDRIAVPEPGKDPFDF